MSFISVFDVLGPNMIGPSSSHTAGALRIAFVAGRMVERAVSVKFVLYGSFARTYHGHGTDRALVAGLLGMRPDDLRIPQSFELAKEEGLDFDIHPIQLREAHPNTVVLELRRALSAIDAGDYLELPEKCEASAYMSDGSTWRSSSPATSIPWWFSTRTWRARWLMRPGSCLMPVSTSPP